MILIGFKDMFMGTGKKTGAIISAVCEYSGHDMRAFRSQCQSAHLASYRQVLIYLLRQYDGRSLKEIGKIVNRHHTTVLHSCEVVEGDLIRRRRDIENIKAMIQTQGLL